MDQVSCSQKNSLEQVKTNSFYIFASMPRKTSIKFTHIKKRKLGKSKQQLELEAKKIAKLLEKKKKLYPSCPICLDVLYYRRPVSRCTTCNKWHCTLCLTVWVEKQLLADRQPRCCVCRKVILPFAIHRLITNNWSVDNCTTHF